MTTTALTEAQWQAQVLDLARLNGWGVYHTHDSRRSAPGFPDLVLWRDRTLFVELKTDTGRLSEDQSRVLAELAQAGAEVHVFRPRDFERVRQVLA